MFCTAEAQFLWENIVNFCGVIIAFLKSLRQREDFRRYRDVKKMAKRHQSHVIGVLLNLKPNFEFSLKYH